MIEWSNVSAWRSGDPLPEDLEHAVPRETSVTLISGGRELRRFTTSPGRFEDLATGFLVSSGVVSDSAHIRRLRLSGAGPEWEIGASLLQAAGEEPYVACPLPSGPPVSVSVLHDAADVTYSQGDLYQLTRGSHAAALFDYQGRLVTLAEDIGRYNAVDKVVGGQMRRGTSLAELFLVVTCRVSLEMVEKIARCRLSLVLTKAAPTDLAVQAAESLNLAVVRRTSDRRLFTYSSVANERLIA